MVKMQFLRIFYIIDRIYGSKQLVEAAQYPAVAFELRTRRDIEVVLGYTTWYLANDSANISPLM